MVAGSIARLGREYVVTLIATNCQSGDTIARVQTQATSTKPVLHALGEAGARLREKLGESLTSIRRFNQPLEDVTTPSLEALKAFSQARSLRMWGKEREAVPLLKHAIELDPNFASAYALLALTYLMLGEPSHAAEHVEHAYALRDRVTERERLRITAIYHLEITGDFAKQLEALTLFQQAYPNDGFAYHNLGGCYADLGQYARAADAYRAAARFPASNAVSLGNLALCYIRLNRLNDARRVLEQANARERDSPRIRTITAMVTHLERDDAATQHGLEWLSEHDPSAAFSLRAWIAALDGRLRTARDAVTKRVDVDIRAGLSERAALTWLNFAETEATFGVVQSARIDVATALGLSVSREVACRAGWILAFSGFDDDAQPLLERCMNEYPPTHTLGTALNIPAIRAALDLTCGHPETALEFLRTAEPYDAGSDGVSYLRACAYLAAGRAPDSATEFEKLIGRGWSPYAPLAHLGRARALRRMDDIARSRAVYDSFFMRWKNADPDLPILEAAKQEYAQLEQ